MKRKWTIAAAVLAATLALSVPTALALSGKQIGLAGSSAYPGATGTAQYQAQQGHRELQIEVQHARSLAGKPVVVYVGGMKLGTARMSSLGKAELTRNTELGQRVPGVKAGMRVAVRTAGGALVVAGGF